jgi:hypothetical protein
VIADYTPSIEELAQLIPSRAAGRFTGGAGAPMFPDPDRVQAVIEDAAGLIAPSLGGNELDRRFWPGAKSLIKLQAALILEPSAWPEQARPEKSAFAQWMELLNSRLEGTTQAIIRFRDEGEGGAGSSQHVIAAFPPPGVRRPQPVLSVSIAGDVLSMPGEDCWPPYGTDW